MIYHFVKNVGIDVEADSLEQATEFVNDIDNYEDLILETITDCNDFTDDVDSVDVHSGYAEYAGYTEDSADEDFESEEDFYKYLTDDCDGDCDHCEYGSSNKEEDVVSFLAELILKSLLG